MREILGRELASSLSYHKEKLNGERIATMLVRTVATSYEELSEILTPMDLGSVESIDPTVRISMGEGISIEPASGQRLAPAIGAAVGRR